MNTCVVIHRFLSQLDTPTSPLVSATQRSSFTRNLKTPIITKGLISKGVSSDTRRANMASPLQNNESDTVMDGLTLPADTIDPATPQQPPADTPTAIWTRRTIIFAFWAIVAALGLPHWIWTTSIHREELPVERMTRWAEGDVSACCLRYLVSYVDR